MLFRQWNNSTDKCLNVWTDSKRSVIASCLIVHPDFLNAVKLPYTDISLNPGSQLDIVATENNLPETKVEVRLTGMPQVDRTSTVVSVQFQIIFLSLLSSLFKRRSHLPGGKVVSRVALS